MIAKVLGTGVCALGMMAFVSGCATEYKKNEQKVAEQKVDCRTAEADLRVLNEEKANVATQIGLGVSMIMPIGLVVGLVQGTEGTKWRVATGDYNKALDAKIAEIKNTCPGT